MNSHTTTTCSFTLILAFVLAYTTLVGGCGNSDESKDRPVPTKPNTHSDNNTNADKADQKPAASTSDGDESAKNAKGSGTTDATIPHESEPVNTQPWPAPANREAMFLDFKMTNQNGKELNLQKIINKPTIATFIFTGCKNAAMCPMQVSKISFMQAAAKKAGIGADVNFLIISFDPDNDTPQKLKKFVQQRGVTFDNAQSLTPNKRQFTEFLDALQIRTTYDAKGEIDHGSDLMIFDANGKRARFYQGQWNNKTVVQELKRLVDEGK